MSYETNGIKNVYGRYRPLPPKEVWLEDPYSVWCPTITDERGIPKPDETLAQVLSLLEPSYTGIKDINTNHFAYPLRNYPNLSDAAVNPHEYRNQAPLIRLLPIDIHNFLHLVLEPSKRPSEEVMSYSIEAWQVAKRLFVQAKGIQKADNLFAKRVRTLKNNPGIKSKVGENDETDFEYLVSNMHKRLRGFDEKMEAYDDLPTEFKPAQINPNLAPERLAEDIIIKLGHYVIPQVVRPARLQEAA
jgi:hypothetical protein